MPAAWSSKDERQYKSILSSCLERDRRKTRRCKKIAGATVNKHRAEEGRTLGDIGPNSEATKWAVLLLPLGFLFALLLLKRK